MQEKIKHTFEPSFQISPFIQLYAENNLCVLYVCVCVHLQETQFIT